MSATAIVIIFIAVMIFCGVVKGIADLQDHRNLKEIARNTRKR